MREMIVSELSQAMHEMARGFAHYVPRLIVMLILAFAGWLIAYVVKVILRSILQFIKFDKLSENAGASQLLNKAALPTATEMVSRFVFWVTWLGFILLGVSVLGILGLHKFLRYRSWFRKELADYVWDACSNLHGRLNDFWNMDFVNRMADEHIAGRKNYSLEINAVLTLDAVERLLLRAPAQN